MTNDDRGKRMPPRARTWWGVAAYAALFILVLPLLAGAWMHRLDRILGLPTYGGLWPGVTVAGLGLLIMALAMRALWVHGHGLAMSPFPPASLVSRGLYALVADPIYIGAVLVSVGYALASRSAAGLWIVSPVLGLSAAAFVMGYERDVTRRRFGALPAPLLRLPGQVDAPPSVGHRVSVYGLVLVPWLVLYEAVNRLGVPLDARPTWLPWDAGLPVVPWTESIYALTYPLVALVPLAARRQRDLRRFAVRGLWATGTILLFYLLVPLVAPAKAVPDGSLWTPLLLLERYTDQQATSLPASCIVWTCLAAELYVETWTRTRWLALVWSLAVGASSITTGMHAVLEVVAGFAAWALIARGSRIWAGMCRLTEAVANSWGERQVGPIRLLSHGVYAAAGGAAGAGVAIWLAGPDELWWIIALTHGSQLGAAAWAQAIEGSPQLLRPYGYFGAVVSICFLAVAAQLTGHDAWRLLAAMAVGGCLTQAIGRLRCLVQGCCHGKSIDASWGIRYRHPRSRVLRLSDLGGVPLHPAPLYSIVWTLLTGFILLRLWLLSAPLPFIAGAYFVLIGLGRFVEEHYRGEPQTAIVAGLRLYQWLAIAFVVGGAAVTAITGSAAPAPQALPLMAWPVLLVVTVITYALFGVDVPGSNRRFSRLV